MAKQSIVVNVNTIITLNYLSSRFGAAKRQTSVARVMNYLNQRLRCKGFMKMDKDSEGAGIMFIKLVPATRTANDRLRYYWRLYLVYNQWYLRSDSISSALRPSE